MHFLKMSFLNNFKKEICVFLLKKFWLHNDPKGSHTTFPGMGINDRTISGIFS